MSHGRRGQVPGSGGSEGYLLLKGDPWKLAAVPKAAGLGAGEVDAGRGWGINEQFLYGCCLLMKGGQDGQQRAGSQCASGKKISSSALNFCVNSQLVECAPWWLCRVKWEQFLFIFLFEFGLGNFNHPRAHQLPQLKTVCGWVHNWSTRYSNSPPAGLLCSRSCRLSHMPWVVEGHVNRSH